MANKIIDMLLNTNINKYNDRMYLIANYRLNVMADFECSCIRLPTGVKCQIN